MHESVADHLWQTQERLWWSLNMNFYILFWPRSTSCRCYFPQFSYLSGFFHMFYCKELSECYIWDWLFGTVLLVRLSQPFIAVLNPVYRNNQYSRGNGLRNLRGTSRPGRGGLRIKVCALDDITFKTGLYIAQSNSKERPKLQFYKLRIRKFLFDWKSQTISKTTNWTYYSSFQCVQSKI